MAFRRTLIRFIGYLIFTLVLALFIYTVLFYETIKIELEHEIQVYGAIGLILTAFAVDTVGGPLGPEIPVIGGLLAGIDFPTVIYMTFLGSGVASLLIYLAGYIFGEYGALHYVTREKYDRWRHFFIRHRKIVLLLGALTPVPYVTVCLIAGVFRARLWEFVLLAIGGRLIRIALAAYVGLLFQGVI